MKQENNENRPSFGLMKLNNIISYYHMQIPRWLFSDSGYSDMALESKVAYTFLLPDKVLFGQLLKAGNRLAVRDLHLPC